MERLTAKRKIKLLEQMNKITPLTKKQIGWCLKDTARYIWFDNHDMKNGHCERCGHDVTFEKNTRHNKEVKCPHCTMKLTINHKWRRTQTWHVDFRAITKVTKPDEYILRYVLIEQHNEERTVSEVAREIVNFTTTIRREFELTENGWQIGNKQKWFTESFMYQWRQYCCLSANAYIPGFKAELKKLDRIKYLDNPVDYNSNRYYVTSVIKELYKRSDLYEKFEKVGLKDTAIDDFNTNCGYSYGKIDYKTNETSLHKMLGLNKANMRRFITSKSIRRLKLMQKYSDIADETMDIIEQYNVSDYDFERVKELKVGNVNKMLRYITSNKMNFHEYCHYIETMQKLGYKMDDSYLYPKDFRKMDNKATEDYNRKQDAIKIALTKAQSKIIKEISDGLRQMQNLAEFMDGSKGLLIYVPESAEDLIKEGRDLHNCISTYVERVAEKKTLVFFVRKIDAPNEPFVAFEYTNGEVIQCRYDHNKNVDDDNIINFVDAFSARLRENKVLVA